MDIYPKSWMKSGCVCECVCVCVCVCEREREREREEENGDECRAKKDSPFHSGKSVFFKDVCYL